MMAYILSRQYTLSTFEQILCKLEQLLYLLVIVPVVAFLPAALAYSIACRRGDWVCRHNTIMHKRLMQNVKGVLGSTVSDAEYTQIVRDFFRRRSCEAIDTMRLAGKGRSLARLIEIRGLDHLETALAGRKGVVLCSAHFGSYNQCYSLLGSYNFPVTGVGDSMTRSDPSMSLVRRLFWRLSLEALLAHHRHRPLIEPRKGQIEAAIQIAEILRNNEVVAIPIDVPVSHKDRSRAVPVDFLNQQILLLPGGVSIAEVTGSPVLVMLAYRMPNWRHQVLEILPPVPFNGDVVTTFKQCVALIEAPLVQRLAHWDYWGNTQDLNDFGLLKTEEAHQVI